MPKRSFAVELRLNRDLIDTNFGSYRLSFDPVPVYKKPVPEGVDYKQPNDDEFSFLYLKLFSFHNHLHVNRYTNSLYYIDAKWNVTKIVLNSARKPEGMQKVWEIPSHEVSRKRFYNVTLAFASHDMAVLSDGAGTTHVLMMSMNDNMETWNIVSSVVLCENEVGFLLSDVKLEANENENQLHVILMHVEQKMQKEKEQGQNRFFNTVIEWVTLIQNETGAWIKKSHKTLQVDGSVEYVALEPGCKALIIVSDTVPKWTFDSEKEIVEEKDEEQEDFADLEKLYTWIQNEEDVTILLKVSEDVKKSDLIITVDSKYLKVKVKGEDVISGDLFHRIEKDLTSWTLENNQLEISLTKQESGQMWQELLLNDKRGEQIFDLGLVGKVHEQLSHLCSDKEVDSTQPSFNSQQLEECDSTSSDTVLVRMSPENHSVTHEVSLSCFQWLFKVHYDPKQTPAICLRQDVDACVWQFGKAEDNEKNWPMKHVGTFSALGYVQASKIKKKYFTSPPDLSYAIICETIRRIYVYRKPSAVNCDLRSRITGEKIEKIAKQHFINLDANEEILGVYATNPLLYVLTNDDIYVFTING